ncbi:Mbeg1-like protein [Chromobacterium haemolyticum]|uniref:Mbeg1-like protein n=1 Tax=Chromobacterium haemolyticum TaxID=394935 RepID=UPI0009DD53AB|nr:Mbeg1-like protein [Chromobacterium haemolyticum]
MTSSVRNDALLGEFSKLAYKDEETIVKALASDPKFKDWELNLWPKVEGSFAAVSFRNKNDGQIVIAYRGTDDLGDVSGADLNIARGRYDEQFRQGMDFARQIKKEAGENANILVTGHSLGGAIAQAVSQSFGFDGATIDPAAAGAVVKTPQYKEKNKSLGLPAVGKGMPKTFKNYVVDGSAVSGLTGPHLGSKTTLPKAEMTWKQKIPGAIVGGVTGQLLSAAIDQVENRHSSDHVSEQLNILAGKEKKPIAAIKKEADTSPKAGVTRSGNSRESQTIVGLLSSVGKTRTYQMKDGSVQTRSDGTVSWRNNNPGNLKFGYAGSADKTDKSKRSKKQALSDASKRYQGVIDLDQWGNAIFETEAAGRAAKSQLLTRQHGNKTIEQMLPKYAISDYSGTADVAAYAKNIHKLAASRNLDLHGKKIKDLKPNEFEALLDGMKKVEGFKQGRIEVSSNGHKSIEQKPSKQPAEIVKPPASVGKPAKAVTPKPAGNKPAAGKAIAANKRATPSSEAVNAVKGGNPTAMAAKVDQEVPALQALLSQLQSTLAQLSSVLSQPIQVTVDVQNGNIVAAVNAANSQQQRRS